METVATANGSILNLGLDTMLLGIGSVLLFAGFMLMFISCLTDEAAILNSSSFIVHIAALITMVGLSVRTGSLFPILFIIFVFFLLDRRKG